MTKPLVVVASPDPHLRQDLEGALGDRGMVPVPAATNLEVVYLVDARGGATLEGEAICALILDARDIAFGRGALSWLRQTPVHRPPTIAIIDEDDEAHQLAELAGTSLVFTDAVTSDRVGDALSGLLFAPETELRQLFFVADDVRRKYGHSDH